MKTKRLEKDILGKVFVDKNAYYGAQTQRASENFSFTHPSDHLEYIYATVTVKKAAARVNNILGLLDKRRARAIISACDEILKGDFDREFIISPYQAGAGTSHNMNVNEVIANRSNQILGAALGTYKYIHPNDHVNMSQSTNDVIPVSIRIASLLLLPKLLTTIQDLEESIFAKGKEFADILKSGRTHLQDALPVTLGQEFTAYGTAILYDQSRIKIAQKLLQKIGIGGTAVGTGINTHPRYHKLMISELQKLTRLPLVSSKNLIEPIQNTADFLYLSASLRILAQTLVRIGNDLRLLSSGPGAGISEITLPRVAPGSSIMPGKINPSIVEMLTMTCYQVIGYDQAILFAGISGQLELNVMLPLIAYNLLEQIKLLTKSIEIFQKKCIAGIAANQKMCQFWLAKGVGLGAILNPHIGYEKAGELVRTALKTKTSIKTLAIKKGYLTKKQAGRLFSPKNLTRPNIKKVGVKL